MSTLTDLFSIRIGASRRAVFAEGAGDTLRILLSQEKLPTKEGLTINSFTGNSLREILTEEGVVKENVYYVLSPRHYYMNKLTLPFPERQKIESVIKYEVRDFLPLVDADYLTDFYQRENDITSFSTETEVLSGLLEGLGLFRENLKAVIPFDMALYYSMTALVDDQSYILLDIEETAVYVQYVENLRIKTGILIGTAGGGTGTAPDDEFKKTLTAQLLMVFKVARCSFVYLNPKTGGENIRRMTEDLLEKIGMSFQEVPHHNYERYFFGGNDADGDALALFGAVQGINQPPLNRVNLLKEEFKPRLKGYVSVKEFTLVGILLLLLFIISTASLTIDIRFRKNQVSVLNERLASLSETVFGERMIMETEARSYVSGIQERVKTLEESTSRRFSSLQLLKELSFYLPNDVIIEYSDIIIERDHIKFSGKARTFSDIDRIREELLMSDYFTEVRVSNTGTTGSTEGFTVTYVFDIEVMRE